LAPYGAARNTNRFSYGGRPPPSSAVSDGTGLSGGGQEAAVASPDAQLEPSGEFLSVDQGCDLMSDVVLAHPQPAAYLPVLKAATHAEQDRCVIVCEAGLPQHAGHALRRPPAAAGVCGPCYQHLAAVEGSKQCSKVVTMARQRNVAGEPVGEEARHRRRVRSGAAHPNCEAARSRHMAAELAVARGVAGADVEHDNRRALPDADRGGRRRGLGTDLDIVAESQRHLAQPVRVEGAL